MQDSFHQRLENPAGSSESLNSYLMLMMNLLKVYNADEKNHNMVGKMEKLGNAFL